MNILVTGANSYLGEWVVRLLLESGRHIIFPMDSHGQELHLSKLKGKDHLAQSMLAPLNNPATTFPSIDYRLIDAVSHLGWYSKAGDGELRAQADSHQRTADLTYKLLDHRPDARVVFSSTASVYGSTCYGESKPFPMSEEESLAPTCHYTIHKACGEDAIRRSFPNSHLILRLGSLMGLGVQPRGRTKVDVIVNAFAADGYRTGKIEVWSPGAWKPILHVQDAARIVVEALERKDWVGTINAAWRSIRAIDIATKVAYHTGAEVQVKTDRESRRSCYLDCSRLKRELPGLVAEMRCLGETVEEFRDYYPSPRDVTLPWKG